MSGIFDLFDLTITALLAGVAMSAVMATAWLIQRRTGNSGWIDTSWSLGVGTVAFLLSLYPIGSGPFHWRQLAVATLVLCWCLRLGLHIAGRTKSVTDDPRYRDLIEKWGDAAAPRLFLFLQAQAAVGIVLVLAVVLAAQNGNPSFRAIDMMGFALLLGSIVGEATADRQLERFKNNPLNRGEVCEAGLWSWSRHPNYFFEWLYWVGIAIIALDLSGYQPLGWLAVSAPVCMYWVLNYASGIPPLEEHMLRSRGDKFREYQSRTSAFFPIPPNSAPRSWR